MGGNKEWVVWINLLTAPKQHRAKLHRVKYGCSIASVPSREDNLIRISAMSLSPRLWSRSVRQNRLRHTCHLEQPWAYDPLSTSTLHRRTRLKRSLALRVKDKVKCQD